MRRALLLAVLLMTTGAAGCLVPGASGDRTGDLVRIVTFLADGSAFEDEPNDASDVFAAIADTRFEYTHTGGAVDPDDVTVDYTDEGGRDRSVPLSDFTDLGEVGRGDKVTITGALLTSRMEIQHGDDTLASRGGAALDWLEAGGYPLPFAVDGGLAEWDLSGGVDLNAGFDLLQVVEDSTWYDYVCEEGEPGEAPDCHDTETPYQSTVRFTDALAQGNTDLDGVLRLESLRGGATPSVELGFDGTWLLDGLFNVHIFESSTRPDDDETTDADFGADLDGKAVGDGLLRLGFDRDGAWTRVGSEGTLDLSGRVTVWDEEHPRSEGYTPFALDELDQDFPYDEHDVPFGDSNPVAFVAQALSDLWRMDLAPGDEFLFSSRALNEALGEDRDLPVLSIAIRVVEAAEKEVEAGTFDALRVETTTVIEVPVDGPFERFELPTLTTWVDERSGLPVAVEQHMEYGFDQADFAPLFAKIEEWDEGVRVTAPEELHLDLAGRSVAELRDHEKGLRMAPMAAVLMPMVVFGGPAGWFVPFGFGFPYGGGEHSYESPPDVDSITIERPPPNIAFSSQSTGPGGTVTVIQAEPGILWDDLGVDGPLCSPPPADEYASAGDQILCTMDGRITITHWPTGFVLFEASL